MDLKIAEHAKPEMQLSSEKGDIKIIQQSLQESLKRVVTIFKYHWICKYSFCYKYMLYFLQVSILFMFSFVSLNLTGRTKTERKSFTQTRLLSVLVISATFSVCGDYTRLVVFVKYLNCSTSKVVEGWGCLKVRTCKSNQIHSC